MRIVEPPSRLELETYGLRMRRAARAFACGLRALACVSVLGVPLLSGCADGEIRNIDPSEEESMDCNTPDPCNREGSGLEDFDGCVCAFECPDPGAGFTRVCDAGACTSRPDPPSELCASWCEYKSECSDANEATCLADCPADHAGAIYNAEPACESLYFAYIECASAHACDYQALDAESECRRFYDALAICNSA